MFKVLLVAPTDPEKPSKLKLLVGGENTYTKSLLLNPPKGVSYTYYSEALDRGEIEYTFLHSFLSILMKLRILPIGAGSLCFHIKADFDLVHCHAYGIKIDRDIPIILSDSSSNYLYLRDYVDWPKWRIDIGIAIKRVVLKAFRVLDPDVNTEGARRLIVFSKFAYKLHKKLGAPESKMMVITPGVATNDPVSKKNSNDTGSLINILFVGTWFERKGGPILLEAFKKISAKYSNVKLTIVGEVPKKFKSQNSKVKIYDYVTRERLMREFFPKADIFVLIPPKVEGLGFSVIEAMSFGIVPIVTKVCALPELIEDGKSGFVIKPGNVEVLAEKLERLIVDSKLRERMSMVARKRFVEKFSIEKSNVELLKIYNQALSF